jgi:PAS domain S-box-containing protein
MAWRPIRRVALASALTIVAVAWSGFLIVDVKSDEQLAGDQSTRIANLSGDLSHLDEVLSGSARLAVATGDSKWEDRYRRFEPQLEAAINEVTALVADAPTAATAVRLEEANATLQDMEDRAFALVRAGRILEARAIVFSDQYEAEQKQYAQALASVIPEIEREIGDLMRRDQHLDTLGALGAIVLGVASVLAWLSVLRDLNRSRVVLERALGERTLAKNALAQAHGELESRIEQRTAELKQANHALQAEVAERKSAETTRDRLATILESTTDIVGFADPGGMALYVNPAGRRMLGLTPDEDVTRISVRGFLADPVNDNVFNQGLTTAIREGSWSGEVLFSTLDGRVFPGSQVIVRHNAPDGSIDYIATIIRDLTERNRLASQLAQSQKLETTGRLAGGFAHEFNSILTAIIGRSEFLLAELPAGSSLARHATEIHAAADRAASLTRRLLAFGRKQVLYPETLDLNHTAQDMVTLIRQLVGDAVDVRFVLPTGLHSVTADAAQIEQVIVNLVMNARDAMPDGGRLTVETANVTLDEGSTGAHLDLKPGDYVMLAITDTGTGMSADVTARVFEPFFTTKDIGVGTGLGLSTCDGIVKQSGGYISVYSEPKLGTVFKIYLPRNGQPTDDHPAAREAPRLPRGTETILLVEDDPALREMAAESLRRLGYDVLVADGGGNALKLADECGDATIDLLFTDVVMPQISGTELADRIHASRPTAKTLFTSAFTENAIAHQHMLRPGDALLQKPFTPRALAIKVREVLDDRAA